MNAGNPVGKKKKNAAKEKKIKRYMSLGSGRYGTGKMFPWVV